MKALGALGVGLALALGLITSSGCGGSSKNPVASALDSLPPAQLNQTSANRAATAASGAVGTATKVPQPADYVNSGVVPFALRAAVVGSNLSAQQKAVAAQAFDAMTAVTTPGCPTIIDNSTFPTGTTVDITIDAGAGCTDPASGYKFSGNATVKGTASVATGAVSINIAFNNFSLAIPCTSGAVTMSFGGSGSITASGLVDSSTAISVSDSLNVTLSFGGTCNGQGASGSGFFYTNDTLTGTKSGNVWSFTGASSGGDEISTQGVKVGTYQEWNGTVTVDTKGTPQGTDDTGTIAITGRVGWSLGPDKGVVGIAINANFDHTQCLDEPVSGTLTVTAGANTAVVSFNGLTNGCGCAPWTLNGAAQTLLCF